MRDSVQLNDGARRRLQKLHQAYVDALGNMAIALGLSGPVAYDLNTGVMTAFEPADVDQDPLIRPQPVLRRVEGGADAAD